MFARNEASDAMLFCNRSFRDLAARAGTLLSSLWWVVNCVTLECVRGMFTNNTFHRCLRDFDCLALLNCSSQLMPVWAFTRQSLDAADTLALFMCICVENSSIGILNMLLFPCGFMSPQALRCDYNHHQWQCHVICCFVVWNTSTTPPVLVLFLFTHDVRRKARGARCCVIGRRVAIAAICSPSISSCWHWETGHIGAHTVCNAQTSIVWEDAWRWYWRLCV